MAKKAAMGRQWHIRTHWLCSFMTAFLVLAACAAQGAVTPLPPTEYPVFRDDLALRDLDSALDQSLQYLQTRPLTTRYNFGGRSIAVQRLIDSAGFLQRMLRNRPTSAQLNEQIRAHYEVVRAEGAQRPSGRRLLVTGYYQPLFAGSLERTPFYPHPVHAQPDNLVVHEGTGGQPAIGRLEAGQFKPYWTRREIEEGNLLKGQELVWLKDPFDVFVLHIQGSGHIRLTDGTVRALHYARSNGREYRSIGKLMVDSGRMRLEDVTMDRIRDYLKVHPEERDQILHHNESYIFFQWGKPGPAIGNLGKALTPGRSIAVDQQWLPPGGVAFLDSRKPVVDNGQVAGWERMQRFVTVQDTGSGLKGPGRVDVFLGSGDAAGTMAGQMKEDGALYLLLLKEPEAGAENRSGL